MTDEPLTPTPESQPDSVPDPTPGASLRKVREQAGYSLHQVGERTLIPLARLQALEQDRYDAVGSSAYVAGYARAYARAIGAPPDSIVAAFEAALERQRQRELALQPAAVSGPIDWSDHHRKLWLASMATAVMMGILLTLLILYRLGGADVDEPDSSRTAPSPREPMLSSAPQERPPSIPRPSEQLPSARENPQQATPDAAPLSEPEASLETPPVPPESEAREPAQSSPLQAPQLAPAEPQAEQLLEMIFTGECWVEVHDANGDRVVARLAQSGDNLRLRGQAPFDVLLGDARAASLALNGEPVSVSPRPGRNTLRLQVGP